LLRNFFMFIYLCFSLWVISRVAPVTRSLLIESCHMVMRWVSECLSYFRIHSVLLIFYGIICRLVEEWLFSTYDVSWPPFY
jgi:hypothetical protein